MNVKLVDRDPVHVAYLRHTGAYGQAVGRFWMQTVAPWMGTNNLFGRERFRAIIDGYLAEKAPKVAVPSDGR